jgi:redox-sensing transcriptional repressor
LTEEQSSRSSGSIPTAAVARLSLYLRELRRMVRDDIPRVSSNDLGIRLGVSAAIVRRDLATLGHMGRRGVGYDPSSLAARIRSVLGADKVWNVALFGTGSLGTALLRYRGFAEQGFRLVAAFDIRPDRIGESLGGVPVIDLAERSSVEVSAWQFWPSQPKRLKKSQSVYREPVSRASSTSHQSPSMWAEKPV